MARKIRKKKQHRRQSESRRRWKDIQEDAKREKYAGSWARRARRRKAFQHMKQRKIVKYSRHLRTSEGDAAQRAGEWFGRIYQLGESHALTTDITEVTEDGCHRRDELNNEQYSHPAASHTPIFS